MGLPKQPSWPYPVSSSTMNSTLGAPSLARMGSGQAGLDWSTVRPITPGKVVPGLYSLPDMYGSFALTAVLRYEDGSILRDHSCRFLSLDCDVASLTLLTECIETTPLPCHLPGQDSPP